MRKNILILLTLIFALTGAAAAENVSFTASAPGAVVVEQPFQLRYTLNTDKGKDFRAPAFKDFEVLAGPFQSRSSSYQIINGNATSSVSITYTYTLMANSTGTFTIPSASITIDGDKQTSNGVSVKVLPADEDPQPEKGDKPAVSGNSSKVTKDNIFIRSILSKNSVYENEPVLLTYKIYTTNDIIQFSNKSMSDFNGFMKQEIEQTSNKQLSLENYNGKNYMTAVLFQVLLYPQKSGSLQIDKADFEAVLRIQNNRAIRSIFDDFFDSYTNVNKALVAPSVQVNVKKLPDGKPSDYTGFVGNLKLTSSMSKEEVKVNEAVTLKLSLSGKGNMKLLSNPEIKLMDDLETYDPKVINDFKNDQKGSSGSKNIEYTIIPRHSGSFEIPSVSLSYFDISTQSYKTLKTPVYTLNVLKGENDSEGSGVITSYVNKEEVKEISKDIRYIQTQKANFRAEEKIILGTLLSWMMYLLPLLILIVIIVVMGKNVRMNADKLYVKNKKANGVARKRLKLASKLLQDGKKEQYYEEVLKSVWTYLSDKLSIPVADLSRDRVRMELTSRNISEEKINILTRVIDTCEFARYAPNTGQEAMGNLYEETLKIISELEQSIK